MSNTNYSNPGIASVVQSEQLERLNFATGLRRDPGGYSQYQQQNISAIVNDITNRKQSAFQKAQIDLGRYMDMHHNVNFYKTRSGDVDAVTSAMLDNNLKIEMGIARDLANSRRQFEINEWYNNNKLETLFYLQLVFMSVLLIAIVMYFTKKGMITVGLAGIIYGAIALTLVFVGLYKYYYTNNARDTKLWHRRNFGSTPPPPPTPPGCNDGQNTSQQDIQDALAYVGFAAMEAGQCANNLNSGLGQINAAATNEMVGIQAGKVNALQQVGALGGALAVAACGAGNS